MPLLTEELNRTHQVVRRDPKNKGDFAVLLYGAKGECEQFCNELPAEEGVEHFVEEITDLFDPRLPGTPNAEPLPSPDK